MLDQGFPRVTEALRSVRTRMRRLLLLNLITRHRRKVLDHEPWFIDGISLEDGAMCVWGWALPPRAGSARMSLNGKPFELSEPVARPDVGRNFWQRADAALSGFSVATHADADAIFEAGYARISYENTPTPLPPPPCTRLVPARSEV